MDIHSFIHFLEFKTLVMAGASNNVFCKCASFTILIILLLFNAWFIMYRSGDFSNESTKDYYNMDNFKLPGQPAVHIFNWLDHFYTFEKWNSLSATVSRVFSRPRLEKAFLTIGVPSIRRRNNMTYLSKTILALVNHTTTAEKLNNVVVILLADQSEQYNDMVFKNLTQEFSEFVLLGFLHIVQPSSSYYPSFKNLKKNFRDASDRIKWRSKQVADYCFLFLYAQNISKFYLQLEDDVRSAPYFISAIENYIDRTVLTSWSVLDFSELGFIGKLFRSKDLLKLSQFMMTFYDEQPIDWLIRYWRFLTTQDKILLRKPTLFQHFGETSSFDVSKPNKLQDRYFATGEKIWLSDDPPGDVFSSMKPFKEHTVDLVYGSGAGYFWASNPKPNDSITIVFTRAHVLKRIIIETGSPTMNQTDKIHSGEVFIGYSVRRVSQNNQLLCEDLYSVGLFSSGRFDSSNLPNAVLCILVRVLGPQSSWIVFQQIAVFL